MCLSCRIRRIGRNNSTDIRYWEVLLFDDAGWLLAQCLQNMPTNYVAADQQKSMCKRGSSKNNIFIFKDCVVGSLQLQNQWHHRFICRSKTNKENQVTVRFMGCKPAAEVSVNAENKIKLFRPLYFNRDRLYFAPTEEHLYNLCRHVRIWASQTDSPKIKL